MHARTHAPPAQAGKQIASTEVVLRTPGGDKFAQGTHVKALVPASDFGPVWVRAAAAQAGAAPNCSGDIGENGGRLSPQLRSRL